MPVSSPVGRVRIAVPSPMIRKLAALLGIAAIIAVLAALLWTVHQHKLQTAIDPAAGGDLSDDVPVRERDEHL